MGHIAHLNNNKALFIQLLNSEKNQMLHVPLKTIIHWQVNPILSIRSDNIHIKLYLKLCHIHRDLYRYVQMSIKLQYQQQ